MNDKAEDSNIRKLTRGAPSVAAKPAAVKAGESPDETTASTTGDKGHADAGEPKDKLPLFLAGKYTEEEEARYYGQLKAMLN